MKKRITAILAVMLALATLFSLTVLVGNNLVAKEQMKRLLSCELPNGSLLLDSASIAGKQAGNGNGMQWLGAVLIETDQRFSEEALCQWYGNQMRLDESNERIDIFAQDSPYFYGHRKNRFSSGADGGFYYQISLCKSSVSGFEASFWEKLLNLDPRAH